MEEMPRCTPGLTYYKSEAREMMAFFFKQTTAYEIAYGDWSSDVCSSDLAHRAHRYGGPLYARRDRPPPRARRGAPFHLQLRPAEHPLHHRGEERRAGAADALHRRAAPGRIGHRVLPLAQEGRRDRGVARSRRGRCAALSRRYGRG